MYSCKCRRRTTTMLVDVRSDREFQAYCDRMEQKLHVPMSGVLTAATILMVTSVSHVAEAYVVTRGGPILERHYRVIYRDQYNAIGAQQKAEGVGRFMAEQLRFLAREAARNIRDIAANLRRDIGDIIRSMVRDGKSSNEIARAIRERAPEIGRNRAATIA